MSVGVEWNDATDIERGIYAGVEDATALPEFQSLADFEIAVKAVLEGEAYNMYRALEKEYEYQCDELEAAKVAEWIEENKDELHKIICWLLMQGDFFSTRALHIDDVSEAIDFEDLSELGLIKHIVHGTHHVTDKGKELLE